MAQRWLGLQAELLSVSEGTSFAGEINAYLSSNGWSNRVRRQLTPVHSAAYYLQPSTTHKRIAGPVWQQIADTIKAYAGEPAEMQFFIFRRRSDAFGNADYGNEFLSFWKRAVS